MMYIPLEEIRAAVTELAEGAKVTGRDLTPDELVAVNALRRQVYERCDGDGQFVAWRGLADYDAELNQRHNTNPCDQIRRG